jgi:predicted RNA-binding Zn-ribbon protein involved in translation (DUF1610 family)
MATLAPVSVSTQPAHGLAGILCVVTGSPVAFADCLACTQSGLNAGCPMTAPVIERIAAGIRPPDLADQLAAERGAELGFSVTELLHCPRRQRLQKENTWYEKMEGLYRMTRGTAVHDFLEGYPCGMKATRLDWTFKFIGRTITISGEPDLVELHQGGLFITDYKVTENPPRDRSVWTCSGCGAVVKPTARKGFLCPNCGGISRSAAYRTVEQAQARSSHAMQINLYGLLVEKNLPEVMSALGATGEPSVIGGEVVYLPPTLPMRCAVSYERDDTMTFLKDCLRALLTDDLPPILDEDNEGKWECGYCPLANACASAASA